MTWLRHYFNRDIPIQNKVDDAVRQEILKRSMIVYSFIFVFALVIIIKLIFIIMGPPKLRIMKNIKSDLQKAILLDCTFEDLKILYNKFERIDVRIHLPGNNNYYDKSVDLSYILEDMIFDYYKYNLKDTIYILKLKQLNKECNDKQPFDKLDESQKKLFTTLRDNSGESYYLISENLNSISEELYKKNVTIEKYLDKSNQSYFLSIIALILTLFQIGPYTFKKIKKHMNNMRKQQ
jgi:hypothetical protein